MQKTRTGTYRMCHSRKGQMPFAIIAVTLLLLGSAYAAIESQLEDMEDNSENIESELDAIGASIDKTERFIERGLGEIVYGLSTDADAGTIKDRADSFKMKAEEWMDFQFPTTDGAVLVSMKGFTLELNAESLKMTTADPVTGGYSPAYLRCTGEFTAEYISDSGSSVRTTEVETDGTCALPLAVEQGSVFSNSITGSGSILSQMISYQLTSLAQYRVINGYGALSAYGDMGTESILTEKDVEDAYTNSIKALELISFRNSSDGTDFGSGSVDLADALISKDGYIEVDISAVYSQALLSAMDDIVIKWFDYFYGNRVLNTVDTISDSLKNAWDSLKGFFTGKDEFSAAPYIEQVMESNGYRPSEYRYLFSDRVFEVDIPDMTIKATASGSSKELMIEGFTVDIQCPQIDLMALECITDFKKHYRSDTNEVREWFRNIIGTAAFEIGQSKSFGTIRFKADPADGEAFMQTVSETVRSALNEGDRIFETIMTSAISQQNISDPFYSAICKTIEDNLDSVCDQSTFDVMFRESVQSAISSKIDSEYGTILDPTIISKLTDTALSGDSSKKTYESYKSEINRYIEIYSALDNVPHGQNGMIKSICLEIFKTGAVFADVLTDIPKRIVSMCEEIEHNMDVNTYYGPSNIPLNGDFHMTDGDGGISIEKLNISSSLSPIISIGSPNSNLSECVHHVGFNDESGASYCTMFSVDIRDDIEFSISSTGGLASAAGLNDSEFRNTVSVDLSVKIAVTSGWGLAGVNDYRASNTILGDAWNVLVDLLSPILEPLRKIMSMIMDALSILGSALMEVAKYVSEVVEKLYTALIEPLEQLRLLIEQKLNGIINSVLERAVDAVQLIVGADLSKQTVGFSFMGFELTFSTKLATLVSNTKTLFTVTLGCDFDRLNLEGSITVKQKGSGEKRELIMTGSAKISGKDWNIDADIDPTMRASKHLINMNGVVKGIAFNIRLPELVQYKEIDLMLSDVPGMAPILSNIPVPIPGLKASIDAGVSLKYDLPFKQGILINEFESNPSGTDSGNEWAEIYNASASTVDLDGYTLHAGSDPKKKVYKIRDIELGPNERTVIVFSGSFLNNSKESLTLRDCDGQDIDKTPQKSDSDNDEKTWQRASDAAIDWVFSDGTQDSKNGGGLLGGDMIKTQIIKVLKDAAVDTLGNMGDIRELTDLSTFFETMMRSAITSGIEMIAGCIQEASIFASLELKDATSTGCVGFRIALSVDSGFVEDGLKCIVGEIESLLLNIENPYGIEPKTVLTDNMYLKVTVYTGITAPNILKDLNTYPKVKIGVQISTNVSGICKIIGRDEGTWTVSAGITIMDCPNEIIPSTLNAKKALSSDLWLIKATFGPAKATYS